MKPPKDGWICRHRSVKHGQQGQAHFASRSPVPLGGDFPPNHPVLHPFPKISSARAIVQCSMAPHYLISSLFWCGWN